MAGTRRRKPRAPTQNSARAAFTGDERMRAGATAPRERILLSLNAHPLNSSVPTNPFVLSGDILLPDQLLPPSLWSKYSDSRFVAAQAYYRCISWQYYSISLLWYLKAHTEVIHSSVPGQGGLRQSKLNPHRAPGHIHHLRCLGVQSPQVYLGQDTLRNSVVTLPMIHSDTVQPPAWSPVARPDIPCD